MLGRRRRRGGCGLGVNAGGDGATDGGAHALRSLETLVLLLRDLQVRLDRGRDGVHVPDLLQKLGQLAVLELQREAHLGVLVAQRSQLGEDGE